MLVIEGHGLLGNGSPHNAQGFRMPVQWSRTPGGGHAICTCGEISDHLDSGNARRAWHRQHKRDLVLDSLGPDVRAALEADEA